MKTKSLTRLEEEINNLPYSLKRPRNTTFFYTYLYNKVYAEWEKENKIVKELGGLFVLEQNVMKQEELITNYVDEQDDKEILETRSFSFLRG
jgi:hypothetical protein